MIISIRLPKVIKLTKAGGEKSVEDLGEINTGDPEVLGKFLSRALVTYDRDTKVAIGFWSHGTGIFDTTLKRYKNLYGSKGAQLHGTMIDATSQDLLTTREAGKMLDSAFNKAGLFDRKVSYSRPEML
ncbi:MAG: hypothetical protein D3903_14290 [Candidatus Electrothrix sp. GM3_4]|nr:hypothetical protein [Candidatus Electrothrix sp. GM3_4]